MQGSERAFNEESLVEIDDSDDEESGSMENIRAPTSIGKDTLLRNFALAAMEIKSLVREANGLQEFVQIFQRFQKTLRQVGVAYL